MNRGDSFLDSTFKGWSLGESSTFWPGVYAWDWDEVKPQRRRAQAFFQVCRQWCIWSWTERTATSSSWEENKGGQLPRKHSKSDIPEKVLMRVLLVYSAQGRWVLHENGLTEVPHCRAVSISWLTHLVWPLDCGWYSEEKLILTSTAEQKDCHTWALNWVPLSGTVSVGMPCRWDTWLTSRSAFSLEDGSLERGMKWATLEKL